MPLMPAIRPVTAIIATAAAPISAPPSSEATGVNSVGAMVSSGRSGPGGRGGPSGVSIR